MTIAGLELGVSLLVGINSHNNHFPLSKDTLSKGNDLRLIYATSVLLYAFNSELEKLHYLLSAH